MSPEVIVGLIAGTWLVLGIVGVFLATYVEGEQTERQKIVLIVLGLLSVLAFLGQAHRVRGGKYNRTVTILVHYDWMNMPWSSYRIKTTMGGFAAIRAGKQALKRHTSVHYGPDSYSLGDIDPNM